MNRIKTFGLALMVILVMSVIASATASAVEPTKMLPEPTEKSPVSFTGKGEKGKEKSTLETVAGEKVVCTSSTAKGEATSPNLGTFDALFLGCKAKGIAACKGLKDTVKESVLAVGPFHYWLALLNKELIAVIAILLEEDHFECAFIIEELILVKGCVAAQLTPTDKLTKTATLKFVQTKGVQNITKILPENSTKEIECKLESKKGVEGKFEQSAQEGNAEIEGFKQNGVAIEALFMNK